MPENLWISELRVEVVNTSMRHLYGVYIHQRRLIVLNDLLGPIQWRSTLMHELGHAYYEHTDSTARAEHEASEWAARQMIPGCQFDRLTKMYDSPVSVAYELGVLPRDVVNYAKWRDAVYKQKQHKMSAEFYSRTA